MRDSWLVLIYFISLFFLLRLLAAVSFIGPLIDSAS